MSIALTALAAAAASFPTGFGFGAGYGAGVRIGYDVIYPKIAPFAAKITDDILAAIDNLFGTGGAVQSGGTSGFDFAAGDPTTQQPGEDRRAGPDPSLDTGVSNKKFVSLEIVRLKSGYNEFTMFEGEITVDELRNLAKQYENARQNVGVRSSAGKTIQASINKIYAAIAQF